MTDGQDTTEKVAQQLEQAYYGPLEEQEEEQNKSFLELLLEFIKQKKEASKPKLEGAVS
ncbi:MAG: hypothetical protein ACP5F8_03615 [Candidatus Aenigmatarchaeota archaeon]